MYYGSRREFGFRGRGFGFGGSSRSWPYVGRGRGGLPRCAYPGLSGTAIPYTAPPLYRTRPTREEELDFLKEEAEATKRQLNDIECRIREVERKE